MDLVVVAVVSLLMPPLAWLTEGALRIAVGAAFLLFLPGYAFISALYPLNRNIDFIERIALSFGTSIAVVPLIGLVLNYTPWGIRLTPVMLAVLAFTLCMCGVAAWRRRRAAPDERYRVPFTLPRIDWRVMNTKDRALTAALIASVVFAVGTLVFVVAGPREGERFTEFYILGPEGAASGYPDTVPVGESASVALGIVNHEGATVSYRIEGLLQGDPDALELAAPGVTTRSPSAFVVEGVGDGESWESDVELIPLIGGEQLKAELLLYSPALRVDTHLRVLMGEDGYVDVRIDEAEGEADVTVSPPDGGRHECRIEAWWEGSLVAEGDVVVDGGEEETYEFTYPPGETAFRFYDGGTLILDDRGEELSLHLWIDVPEGGES